MSQFIQSTRKPSQHLEASREAKETWVSSTVNHSPQKLTEAMVDDERLAADVPDWRPSSYLETPMYFLLGYGLFLYSG